MKEITVVGIDPSIRSAGFAVLKFDSDRPAKTVKVVMALSLQPKQTISGKTRAYFDRQKDILSVMKSLIKELNPHIVVVESQVIHEKVGKKIGLELAALSGAMIGVAQENSLAKIINPYSSEWQKAITGVTAAHGREASKRASIAQALVVFGELVDGGTQEELVKSFNKDSWGRDVADALNMALYGMLEFMCNGSEYERPDI